MHQGLDDAKPIIQANPVSLMAREYEALAAAMRVGLPARRHRTGSVANLGSFLSIGSGDSQQSGMLSNGPLHALARTGSRLFGSILGDLPPLVCSSMSETRRSVCRRNALVLSCLEGLSTGD